MSKSMQNKMKRNNSKLLMNSNNLKNRIFLESYLLKETIKLEKMNKRVKIIYNRK